MTIPGIEINETSTKKKAKIGYVFNHSIFLGGGEISFLELIRSLDKSVFDSVIIVPGKGDLYKKLQSENHEVQVNPFPSLRKISGGSPFFAFFRLCRILKKLRIDVLHVNGSRACFYVGLAGRLLNIPVVWHVRETIKDLYIYDYLLGLFSSVIICVSKSVKDTRFQKFSDKIREKITVVYNGVDTQKFKPDKQNCQRTRTKLGVDNDVLFGVIGNIRPLKGHDFFLKAFARAKKKHPHLSGKALIIGRPIDRDYNKKIYQLVSDLKIDQDIIFRNYSEDIQKILPALNVFSLPSKREGFSRSLLEAMSVGLPVLATKIDAIEEAVKHNENAILFAYDNLEDLADGIIKFAKTENLRKEMGIKNRKRAIENFDLTSHTKSIQKIYDSILKINL